MLGIDKRTHDAMFDAVWKTGELAVLDPRTQRLRVPMPGLQDMAKFYERTAGVKAATFIATANSFSVDTRVRQADQLVKDHRTGVETGNVSGDVQSAGGPDQVIELVKWLVAKESPGATARPSTH